MLSTQDKNHSQDWAKINIKIVQNKKRIASVKKKEKKKKYIQDYIFSCTHSFFYLLQILRTKNII